MLEIFKAICSYKNVMSKHCGNEIKKLMCDMVIFLHQNAFHVSIYTNEFGDHNPYPILWVLILVVEKEDQRIKNISRYFVDLIEQIHPLESAYLSPCEQTLLIRSTFEFLDEFYSIISNVDRTIKYSVS